MARQKRAINSVFHRQRVLNLVRFQSLFFHLNLLLLMRHCHIFIGFETALEIPPTNITIKCVESFDDRKEVVGTSDSHPLIGSNRIDVVSKEADNEMSEPEPWQTPKNIFTHGRHSKLRRRIIFAEFRTKVLDESFDEIEEENRQQSFPYNAIETNDVHQQRRKEPRQIRKTASEKIQNDVRKFVVPNRRCSTVFSMDDYFTAAESSSSSPSLNNSLSLSLSSESNDDDVSNMSNATAIFIADGKQKRPQRHVDAIKTALSFCPPSNEEGESLKPTMAGTAKKTQIPAHFGKQQIAAKSVSTNNETTKMFPNSTYLISSHANTGEVTGILPSTETPNTLLITENGKENGFRVALSPSKVARQNSFADRPPPHKTQFATPKIVTKHCHRIHFLVVCKVALKMFLKNRNTFRRVLSPVWLLNTKASLHEMVF